MVVLFSCCCQSKLEARERFTFCDCGSYNLGYESDDDMYEYAFKFSITNGGIFYQRSKEISSYEPFYYDDYTGDTLYGVGYDYWREWWEYAELEGIDTDELSDDEIGKWRGVVGSRPVSYPADISLLKDEAILRFFSSSSYSSYTHFGLSPDSPIPRDEFAFALSGAVDSLYLYFLSHQNNSSFSRSIEIFCFKS